ncbi:substrate-binding domain-containing protein [Kribbella catacumbae]|uniref:substrate-binding domain-containing protein n=1 Tax=Kribbella catacumbae TaxID=460086 RepID=UPI0003766EB0|nr:substrate-binding domain-containing protein [Kribbella catacumbae]
MLGKRVHDAVRDLGCRRMMVMESDEDPALEYELVEDLMRCCDGVLLCSPRMPRAELIELVDRKHPMVLFNRVIPSLGVPSISVDFQGGMTQSSAGAPGRSWNGCWSTTAMRSPSICR